MGVAQYIYGGSIELPSCVLEYLETLNCTYEQPYRSLLYMPLNKKNFFEKINTCSADCIIFDLEDSVPQSIKNEARKNISKIPQAQKNIQHILRINSYNSGLWQEDLEHINNHKFDALMLTKVSCAEEVISIRDSLSLNMPVITLIETIEGLYDIKNISEALKTGDLLAFGAGDLSLEFGINRLNISKSTTLSYALYELIKAGKKNKLGVIDSPYRQLENLTRLTAEIEYTKNMGVTGKQAIHPSHVEIINRLFTPTKEELEKHIKNTLLYINNGHTHAINDENQYLGKPALKYSIERLKEAYEHKYFFH